MSKNIDDKMREHALRIMEALSGVDEELLERCGRAEAYGEGQESMAERTKENEGRTAQLSGMADRESGPEGTKKGGGKRKPGSLRRRPLWQSLGTWAAALLLVVAWAASWRGYQLSDKSSSEGSGGGSTLQQNGAEYSAIGMSSAEERQAADEGCLLGEIPEAGAAGDTEADGTKREVSGAYGYEEVPEEGAAPDSGGDSVRDECWEIDGLQEAENAVREEAGKVSAAPESAEEKFSAMHTQKYTEQEARELEGLGSYVPDTVPEGYRFERACADSDPERENLMVCWSRGTDYILLYLEKTQGPVEAVDIEKPETYDQRLYEVPYGETVPEEYLQMFMDPVFALDDLSLEVIESRMMSYEDAGDTHTPRGGFRVLYPEGVMVSFRGCGTAEEIWDMFCSMGK